MTPIPIENLHSDVITAVHDVFVRTVGKSHPQFEYEDVRKVWGALNIRRKTPDECSLLLWPCPENLFIFRETDHCAFRVEPWRQSCGDKTGVRVIRAHVCAERFAAEHRYQNRIVGMPTYASEVMAGSRIVTADAPQWYPYHMDEAFFTDSEIDLVAMDIVLPVLSAGDVLPQDDLTCRRRQAYGNASIQAQHCEHRV